MKNIWLDRKRVREEQETPTADYHPGFVGYCYAGGSSSSSPSCVSGSCCGGNYGSSSTSSSSGCGVSYDPIVITVGSDFTISPCG